MFGLVEGNWILMYDSAFNLEWHVVSAEEKRFQLRTWRRVCDWKKEDLVEPLRKSRKLQRISDHALRSTALLLNDQSFYHTR